VVGLALSVISAETAVLAPFVWVKTHRNFIRIIVAEGGAERQRVFQLTSSDARSLAESLRQTTGRSAMHLDLAGALRGQRGWVGSLRFRQIIGAGRRYFFPGAYDVVFLEGPQGRGMLYLFPPGGASLEQMIVALPARCAEIPADEPFSAKVEPNPDGTFQLLEIRGASKSVQLPARENAPR
jgi:hypothetical protein